ncbi:MAG: flagellar FlbD family protein [Leptospiraceae bacterium]|nr:flagellar FlbD family protein [Leptospiraceae bacterium]MCZ8346567.1 flagellar FlbD family protein [Leptospiraceae bacterium]PJE03195.1 MAG: flagellar protein [Leptospira sp.]
MIVVHRLKGEEFVINANLIETIEANPDTVISLTTDRKFVVKESVPEVLKLIKNYHKEVIQKPMEG